jgi:ferredoxin
MPDPDIIRVRVAGDRDVCIASGRRLVLGLEDAGVDILHRCGGNARCATCRVEVLDGDTSAMTPWEDTRLSQVTDRKETTRLACQVRVESPLVVAVANRLSAHPEMSDPGPRPVEWPADRALAPED